LIYFRVKSTLKNNHNHTPKHIPASQPGLCHKARPILRVSNSNSERRRRTLVPTAPWSPNRTLGSNRRMVTKKKKRPKREAPSYKYLHTCLNFQSAKPKHFLDTTLNHGASHPPPVIIAVLFLDGSSMIRSN